MTAAWAGVLLGVVWGAARRMVFPWGARCFRQMWRQGRAGAGQGGPGRVLARTAREASAAERPSGTGAWAGVLPGVGSRSARSVSSGGQVLMQKKHQRSLTKNGEGYRRDLFGYLHGQIAHGGTRYEILLGTIDDLAKTYRHAEHIKLTSTSSLCCPSHTRANISDPPPYGQRTLQRGSTMQPRTDEQPVRMRTISVTVAYTSPDHFIESFMLHDCSFHECSCRGLHIAF